MLHLPAATPRMSEGPHIAPLEKLGHIHLRLPHLPEPHEHPPQHHEGDYFEAARMSREMEHL